MSCRSLGQKTVRRRRELEEPRSASHGSHAAASKAQADKYSENEATEGTGEAVHGVAGGTAGVGARHGAGAGRDGQVDATGGRSSGGTDSDSKVVFLSSATVWVLDVDLCRILCSSPQPCFETCSALVSVPSRPIRVVCIHVCCCVLLH